MVDLVPELELIIGAQAPVPQAEPQQAQGRFQRVVRRFIGVFARPEHPLALFLDDLQWLDAATLDLLEDLLVGSDLRQLMLIGAYRDNEVNFTNPLIRKLDTIRSAGGKVAEITLAPLDPQHLGQLIADTLRCDPARAAPLAHLLDEHTGGNPFFAIQFISSLADEGMLAFDHHAAQWSWDFDRIHAKGYTDNVVDLMVGKLTRLPAQTLNGLRQLACVGISADITTLAVALEISEDEVSAALWPAVRQELVDRLAGGFRFVHDRVQEAAYMLVPEERRAETHLRIGRLFAAHTPPEKWEETIFDIVNQLNRGTALITSQDEREQLAELNLLAGKRAKASSAYASALNYLAAGMTLLSEDSWERRYDLMFSLELRRAECEFLTGERAAAEKHLAALADRAVNAVEQATVASLRIELYTALDRTDSAVAIALDYLREVAIDWPRHPTVEVVECEYQRIWMQLGNRTIEELIELPLMTNTAWLATLDVLIKAYSSAMSVDANLSSLMICRAVNLSLEHGNSDASCFAYVMAGSVGGVLFGDYPAAFRFGQLGCDLVEKRGLKRFQHRTILNFAVRILPWARHVTTSRDLVSRAFTIADSSGDVIFATNSRNAMVTVLLAAGDPLGEVQREAEDALAFVSKARIGIMTDILGMQIAFMRTLRGLTRTLGSFDDGRFDELHVEQRLSGSRGLAFPESWYWVRKLQVFVMAGDYTAAIEALSRAQSLIWASGSAVQIAEYHFYGALACAGFCDLSAADQRQQHLDDLAAHFGRLRAWADSCPENFENRVALVGAEIARIEGRELDAMRLYEQAVRSARANGFVQNEALANEVAALFYATRGYETIAQTYFRNARHCYFRWGADGKVRQLDELHPHLREHQPGPTSMIGADVEHLDLATVIKVSEAVSSEIVLEKLLEKLMSTATAQAGAERALLILASGAEWRIAAEAATSSDTVDVHLRRNETVTAALLPESVFHYVLRARESVILDDASVGNPILWGSLHPPA